MKKMYSALALLILTACSGYQPLYGELGDKMNEIGLKQVKMETVKRDIGERRLAQLMDQKLRRIFINDFDNDYHLYVVLSRNESAIATKSDDTDKRKTISITATMTLKDAVTNKTVFQKQIVRSSSYTVQDEPFATESARTKAAESITSTLSNDIIQRAALWFRGYAGNENFN